ncbi:MAG: hypothetical protein ACR2OR_16875 [Hyphomicrobiales bacterium]
MAVGPEISGLRAMFGLEKSDHELCILVIGQGRDDFAHAAELASRIEKQNSRTGVIFSSPDTSTVAWLAGNYPGKVASLPFNGEPFSTLFLSNRHVRAALIIGSEETVPGSLAGAIRKRAVPVKVVKTLEGNEELSGEMLEMAGRERSWDERRDMKLRHFLGDKLLAAMENPKRRQRLAGKITRYDSACELAVKLGNPQTILCLGNGPSSKDPRLKSETYDAVLRANHTWLGQSDFTNLALVFTGLRSAMRKLKGPVIGVASEASEKMLLAQRGIYHATGPLDYFVFEKLTGVCEFPADPVKRPTSGAYLLAAAVAMQPGKLVIAGMDMFAESESVGAGPSGAQNGYTPAHGFDYDLKCILAALEEFNGELDIVSEALSKEWDAYKKAG